MYELPREDSQKIETYTRAMVLEELCAQRQGQGIQDSTQSLTELLGDQYRQLVVTGKDY
jgi:hypothetical protein